MVNDTTIIAGIIIFFLACGLILPFIHKDFGGQVTSVNMYGLDKLTNTTATDETECRWIWTGAFTGVGLSGYSYLCDLPKTPNISAWDVTISISRMFFWSFGDLPLFIEWLIFVPLRVLLIFLVARLIRGGSG